MANDDQTAAAAGETGSKTPAKAGKRKPGRPPARAAAAPDGVAELKELIQAQARQIADLQAAAMARPAPALVPMSDLDLGPDGGMVRTATVPLHPQTGLPIFDANRPTGKR